MNRTDFVNLSVTWNVHRELVVVVTLVNDGRSISAGARVEPFASVLDALGQGYTTLSTVLRSGDSQLLQSVLSQVVGDDHEQ